ncbi:MAG TPA: putative sulfate exporter family transporter [Puia sp.]|uniref:YeiH family protein n=1 Tax=Puia sp. TaxID=2045100 RepID=UPI002C5CA4E7|nr:putative sulfate exporter family transporter [Puia sp.]HVU94635.1 putative sulfate exporter family transporter [Puia sp.]
MDTIKVLDRHVIFRQILFAVAVLLCLTPLVSAPMALVLGLVIALFVGHPFLHLNHKATHLLLQVSVVGLGFGINAATALKAGREGFLFTVVSIFGTLTFGLLLGRWMKIDRKTSLLISGGTAICGGSAIAALSPVIRAEERQVSVALGAVFILNSVALFLFPVVGHLLGLSQAQFGLWSAIAIHDTSSVVGAAGRYGPEALAIATTVKLARALWIIPVSLGAALAFRRRGGRAAGGDGEKAKVKIPWFIGLFVVAILLNTWLPMPALSHAVVGASHAGLTLTLFLIGSGLSRQVLKNTGVKPLVQGVVVWVLIASATLWAVMVLA